MREWEILTDGVVWEALALLSTVNTLVMLIISSLLCHGWMRKKGGGFSRWGIKGEGRMDEPIPELVDGWTEWVKEECIIQLLLFSCIFDKVQLFIMLNYLLVYFTENVPHCIHKWTLLFLFYYFRLSQCFKWALWLTWQKANYLSSLIYASKNYKCPSCTNMSYWLCHNQTLQQMAMNKHVNDNTSPDWSRNRTKYVTEKVFLWQQHFASLQAMSPISLEKSCAWLSPDMFTTHLCLKMKPS